MSSKVPNIFFFNQHYLCTANVMATGFAEVGILKIA